MLETGLGNDDSLRHILGQPEQIKQAEILEFFPQLVYKKFLDPEPHVFDAMVKFIEMFDERTQNDLTTRSDDSRMEEGGMSGGMSGSGDRPKRQAASTGDVTGTGNISGLPEFQWLTSEIEKCVIEYLDRSQVDTRLVSLFHQKSWPVVTRKDTKISLHKHPNASISAAYYLNDMKQDEGGNLLFHNPNDPLISGHIIGEKLHKSKRVFSNGIRPSKNMVVIFPSNLKHSVTQLKCEENRYSIAYDIMLTAARMVDPGSSENITPHTSYWRPFDQQPSEDVT